MILFLVYYSNINTFKKLIIFYIYFYLLCKIMVSFEDFSISLKIFYAKFKFSGINIGSMIIRTKIRRRQNGKTKEKQEG